MGRKYSTQEEENVDTLELQENHLVVHNDDVNTFDWVIESLIKVCNHDRLQAEQCSYIVHNNGKCSVKNGMYNELRPMKEALLERGLSATIE